MSYVIEFVDQVDATDTDFETNGVTQVVDPKGLFFLIGTQDDFAQDGLNEGFHCNYPHTI